MQSVATMNPLVFHIVSGDAYFSGLCLIALGVWCSKLRRRIFFRSRFPLILIGILFVTVTAVPSRHLEHCLLAAIFVLSPYVAARAGNVKTGKDGQDRQVNKIVDVTKTRGYLAPACLAVIGLTLLMELRWRFTPRFETQTPRTLIIFADSITAGIGESEATTWPRLLADQYDLAIYDFSRMGATVGSQLKWLDKREFPDGLIFIELGGNDLFGATTVEEFTRELDQFLHALSQTGQPIVMMELPIPPTFNKFGITQRQLAEQHGVQLISKRVLARVLADKHATLDSIHLSQSGHANMAKAVWFEIQTAF